MPGLSATCNGLLHRRVPLMPAVWLPGQSFRSPQQSLTNCTDLLSRPCQHAGARRGLTNDEQATALAAWVDAMGLPPAAYVGHSLSCQTVVDLAADHPGRAVALILAAPTGDRSDKRRIREIIGFARDITREPLSLAPWIAEAYLRAGWCAGS